MEKKVVLAAIIRELGIDLSSISSDFSTRFKIQKYIYFLQEGMGYNLNFKYNLYLYGPYSPELMNVAFSVASEINIETPSVPSELSSDISKLLNIFPDNNTMEAAATLLFISKQNYLQVSPEEFAKSKFDAIKPNLIHLKNTAWTLLINNQLL